jgi:5-methylcytosine-specific restriction endonuclease McrA
MPNAPKKYIAPGTPTPKDTAKQYDRRRGSFRQRGYTYKQWDKLKEYLKQLPQFVCCDECGGMRELFDHIIPVPRPGITTAAMLLGISWTDEMMTSLENISPKCRRCHDAKTRRFDGGHGQTPDASAQGRAEIDRMLEVARKRAEEVNTALL